MAFCVGGGSVDDQQSYWWNGTRRALSRRRLLSAAGLAAAGAGLTAACGGKSPQQQPKTSGGSQTSAGTPVRGGTMNFYQPTNAPTLDPQRTTSYFTMQPCGAVYSRLFDLKVGPDPTISESAETIP